MARISPAITALNAGEFSNVMDGRIDFEKYPASLRRGRNVFLWSTGAASKRAGFRYLHDIADETKVGRLIPFIFSSSTAYMMEFGDNIIRFNKQQAAISAANVTSTITNGTFTSNINDWDDISVNDGIAHDSGNGRLQIGGVGEAILFDDDMSADTWTKGSGWTYDAGNDEYDASSANGNLTIAQAFVAGKNYRFEVVWSNGSSGQYKVRLTGVTPNSAGPKFDVAVGTDAFNLKAKTDATTIEIDPQPFGGDVTGSVTSFKITPIHETSAAAEQDVTTSETGTEHIVKFQSAGTVGAEVRVQVGTATTLSDTLSPVTLGMGWHAVAFTPTTSPYFLQFINDNESGEAIYIDDVSILDNVPLEISSPYPEADISNLRFVQTADVVYIYHPTYWPYKIERRGDTTWSIVEVPWDDGPWLGINPERKLSEDNLVDDGLFEEGIRNWSDNSTSSGVIKHDGAQSILVLTKDADGDAATGRTTFTTLASTDHVIHYQVVGAGETTVNLGTAAGGTEYFTSSDTAGWYSVEFTTTVATTAHIEVSYAATEEADEAGGVGGFLCYHAGHNLLTADAMTGAVTVKALGAFSPFLSTDVGRYIRLEWPGRDPGWGVITAFTDTQTVTVQVRREFSYVDVPTESWRLGAWSSGEGHPSVASFFEGRNVVAANAVQPQTLWFSQSADIENMRPDSFVQVVSTVEDDDALVFTIASPEIEPVEWMIGRRELIVGTTGGQSVANSDGLIIKATDINIRQHTQTKSAGIDPIPIGSTGVFVEAAGRMMYDIGFVLQQDSFVTADLTVLADHLFRRTTKIIEIAFQSRPHSLIWARRDDGRLVHLKYDRPQNVVGWTQNILGGSFATGEPVVESVATIPGTDLSSTQDHNSGERDEVWTIVKRTVNGSTVRTIEVQEFNYEGPLREDFSTTALWLAAIRDLQRDAFYVDSGVTIDTPVTISGATAADPVVITATTHGFSDGDEVIISDVLGMTELNFNKYLAATEGNANTFKLTAITGAKTITAATQANPVEITSVAHGFVDGDEVGIFSVGGMTEINGFVFTVANKADDTFELTGEDGTGHTAYTTGGSIYHATDGSAFTAYDSAGIVRKTLTTIAVAHLEGESVMALIDGKVSGPHTVSSGIVTPSESYGVAQCGLPYTMELEPAALPYGAELGSAAGKHGRIPQAGAWLTDTGPFDYAGVDYDQQGRTEHTGETADFNLPSYNTAHQIPFFSGILHLTFGGDWSRDPRFIFKGSDPVPFTLSAVGPIIERTEG